MPNRSPRASTRRAAPSKLAFGALALTAARAGDDPAKVANPSEPGRVLRISADPNNMPFTNDRREGFENKIAGLLAADLGADLRYEWRAQHRGFFRAALAENEADLVLGVPVGSERALTPVPYYRSSYVFAARKGRTPAIRSFDDPELRNRPGITSRFHMGSGMAR